MNLIGNWAVVIRNIALCLFLLHMITFFFYEEKIFNFQFWFISLSYVFLFGHVFLEASNASRLIPYNVMFLYPTKMLYKAGLFCVCYIHLMFIGLMYSKIRSSMGAIRNKKIRGFQIVTLNEEKDGVIEKSRSENNAIRCTGLFLLVISLPFRLLADIETIYQTQTASSYLAFERSSTISDDIAVLFVPGLIYLICGNYRNKSARTVSLLLCLVYFVLFMILTGDRRYPVISILVVILCYLATMPKKIKLSEILIFGIIAILLLNMLAVLREIRLKSLVSIGNFFIYYGNMLFEKNPIIESASEFGVTFITVVLAIKYIPSVIPFQNGFSFYGAIPSLLPIGWLPEVREIAGKVSIFRWINGLEGIPAGGSLPGELYANFGWLGILVAFGAGLVLSKMFSFDNNRSFLLNCARNFSGMYILTNLVRTSFAEVFRASVFVYLIPLIIFSFIMRKPSRNVGDFQPAD